MNVVENLSIPPALGPVVLAVSLGSLMLLLALGAHGVLGKGRTRARSAVWNACALGLLALPAASMLLPGRRKVEAETPLEEAPSVMVPSAVETQPPEAAMPVAPPVEIEAEPVRESLSWLTLATGAYLAVALWLLGRLAVGLVAVGRLRRRGLVLEDGPWADALEHWRRRLGLDRPVRLASTHRVSGPVVLGWLRPTVLVPEPLAKSAARTTADAVILHELAHVRRDDYFWNLLWKLAQALYWPHPLVWLGSRLASSTREQACDALCVYWLDDASSYRNTLVEVAARLVRRPPVALGMTMASGSKLGRRLADLEGSEGADTCRADAPTRWALGMAFLALAMLGGVLKPASAPALAGPVMVLGDDKHKGGDDEAKPADEPVKMVGKYRIIKPHKATVKRTTSMPGTVQAGVAVNLYARHSGIVKVLNVDIGERVQAGDVLAEIDAPELEADVRHAETALEQARARSEQVTATVVKAEAGAKGAKANMERVQAERERSQAELTYRKSEFKRMTDLEKRNAVGKTEVEEARHRHGSARAGAKAAEAAIPEAEADVEQAEAELMVVSANVRVALADIHAAEDDLRQARARLEWSRIKTPVSGTVTHRNINRGEFVRSAENAPRPAFTVADADFVRVLVKVRALDVPALDVGDPATVHLDALPNLSFEGKVSRVPNVLDPETQSMLCEIDLSNPDGKIRPGMYGAVTITLDQRDDVLTVPKSSVTHAHSSDLVCYRLVDGRAVASKIRIGYSNKSKGLFEILDGLGPDDLVIANPDSRIKDGEPLPEDEPDAGHPEDGLDP